MDKFGFDEYGFSNMSETEEVEQLILTYVPTAEFLSYGQAIDTLYFNMETAAELLLNSLVEGSVA
jgi:hypothetical protein